MSFQQNAFQHNALQTGVAAGSAPVQLDGGDEFGWLGLQSVIGGVVLAAAALVSGNAQSQTVKHQDEVPYVTGNPIGYGQPYTQRAQVKPVFISWAQGDEFPQQAAPTAELEESLFVPFSVKSEISLPALWPDETISRIQVEESQWDSPFTVPQIPVAPIWEHQDEFPQIPVTPALEESEFVGAPVVQPPVLDLWLAQDEIFTGTIDWSEWEASRFPPEPSLSLWNAQDEVGTPLPAFTPSEEDWAFSHLWKDDANGIIWATDEDIAPAFAVEEIEWRAEWLIPQPFLEVYQAQDDRPTPAATPQGGGGVVYDEISIFRWYQEDPLPVTATPLGIDEEPWKPPVLSLEGPKWLDSTDELIVPQPAPTIREDDYWLGCPTFLPEAIRAVWDSQDEILPSIRDEEPWMGASYPLGPVVQVSDYSDDIVPQPPTAISVEETYWIQPDPPRDVVTSWQFQTDVNEDFPELSEPPVIPEEPRVINLAPGWPLRFLVYINGKPHYGTQEEIDELLEELAEKDAEKPKKTRTRIVVQQGKPIFEKVPAPNKTQLLQFQSNFRDHYLKAYAKYKLEEDDEDDWLLLL